MDCLDDSEEGDDLLNGEILVLLAFNEIICGDDLTKLLCNLSAFIILILIISCYRMRIIDNFLY